MSGSFESMQWNACVHRLDLGLYSHPKDWWERGGGGGGDGVRNHVSSKGKIPSTVGSEKVEAHDAASSRTASPTHYLPSELFRPSTVRNQFHDKKAKSVGLTCCKYLNRFE